MAGQINLATLLVVALQEPTEGGDLELIPLLDHGLVEIVEDQRIVVSLKQLRKRITLFHLFYSLFRALFQESLVHPIPLLGPHLVHKIMALPHTLLVIIIQLESKWVLQAY
jgi:hypothetical protein